MAQKSKTQRAKASAARQARKEQKAAEEAAALAKAAEPQEEPKKSLVSRILPKKDESKDDQQVQQKSKTEKAPVKKSRFQFLKDVRSELRRVTWPSRQDVLRWSLVVVAALVFFGVYVAVLDNVIITPLLVAISGLV